MLSSIVLCHKIYVKKYVNDIKKYNNSLENIHKVKTYKIKKYSYVLLLCLKGIFKNVNMKNFMKM